MNEEINLSDLDGWLSPEVINGYGDFHAWLLIIPVGLIGLAAVVPLFPRLPNFLAWLSFFVFAGLALFSFWSIAIHAPEEKAKAISSDYLDWFDENYGYLHLENSEKLALLNNSYGFLDEDAKAHYILSEEEGKDNVKYLYYLSAENEYTYLPAPQKADSLFDVEK